MLSSNGTCYHSTKSSGDGVTLFNGNKKIKCLNVVGKYLPLIKTRFNLVEIYKIGLRLLLNLQINMG